MASTASNHVEDQNVPLLNATGVYHIYRGRAKRASVVALKGLNLRIEAGEFIGVVGPSGSGKSTLMSTLGGIMTPTAGHIHYEGCDITSLSQDELTVFRRRMVGFVFQEGNLLPQISAYNNVNQAMAFNGWSYESRKKRALELLETVGVLHRKNQLAFRLSGGERQRVAIARALSNKPKLIIADEPTGNVDYKNSIHLLELFKTLNKEIGMSFLIATHSNTVASYADRSMELRDGMFVGQHGEGIDLSELDTSRIVIMDEDNRMTIPKHVLQEMGETGKLWTVDRKDNQIVLTPFDALTQMKEPKPVVVTKDVSTKECPVCGVTNDGLAKICISCGAKF
ncbi:MAG: ABC transporter ATP-binding protein [Candidatus Hodarchaeales archaeon]|jgi:ABC-type lipoprotein export system ATPase subunit